MRIESGGCWWGGSCNMQYASQMMYDSYLYLFFVFVFVFVLYLYLYLCLANGLDAHRKWRRREGAICNMHLKLMHDRYATTLEKSTKPDSPSTALDINIHYFQRWEIMQIYLCQGSLFAASALNLTIVSTNDMF